MNEVKTYIEYEKCVRKYCLNCRKTCFMHERHKLRDRLTMRPALFQNETPDEMKRSFLACFKPKEMV